MRFHPVLTVLAVLAVAALAACSGSRPVLVRQDTVTRGNLVGAPVAIATVKAAELDAMAAASGYRELTGSARCDVTVAQVIYRTPGAQPSEMTSASAAVLVPSGIDCPGPFPLIAYGRGTTPFRSYAMANPRGPETIRLMTFFAAQGYAVVATDYLGYARSSYPYHPYMHADSEASSMVDSIRAARNAATALGLPLNGKVMVTGYSQGGHASMAAQRAIERDDRGEIDLVAAAHIAGPYSVSGALIDGVRNPILGVQALVPFQITSWQMVYGDVYDKVADVFKSPYDGYMETIFPTLLDEAALYRMLPGGTPVQARDAMFKAAYLSDLADNPGNGTIVAAKRQDLLDWNPQAPTTLCGGRHDPTVKFPVNTMAAYSAFMSRGGADVFLVDVDERIHRKFSGVDPATYMGNYHAEYEPTFCLQVAKQAFDRHK